MKKKNTHVTKEIIIMMILVILIMLILAVALYDFVPTNINLPEPIEYMADSKTTSIKQEIMYTNAGEVDQKEENVKDELKSYSIQASELTVYSQKNLYNKGNSNPFDYAVEDTTTTTTENGTGTTNPNTNTTTNTTSTTTNSTTNTTGATTTGEGNQTTTQSTNANITSPTSGTTTGNFFEKPSSK